MIKTGIKNYHDVGWQKLDKSWIMRLNSLLKISREILNGDY